MQGDTLSPSLIVALAILAHDSSRSRSSESYSHELTNSMSTSNIVSCLESRTSSRGPFREVASRDSCLPLLSPRLKRVVALGVLGGILLSPRRSMYVDYVPGR